MERRSSREGMERKSSRDSIQRKDSRGSQRKSVSRAQDLKKYSNDPENKQQSDSNVDLAGGKVEAFEDVTSLNTPQLANWLKDQLKERFTVFHAAFLEHKIDGKCFSHVSEKHLQKMASQSTIGDRLHVLAIRDRIIRAARISRRNQVVMEGSAFINPPGAKAKYVLTNGALKLIFTRKKTVKVGEATEKTIDSSFIDHIDLSSITDVDIEQSIDMEEVYETFEETVGGGCMSKPKLVKHTRLVNKIEKNVAHLYISLKTAPQHEEETGNTGSPIITLTAETLEEGNALHAQLIDCMEEVQQVQIVHYE